MDKGAHLWRNTVLLQESSKHGWSCPQRQGQVLGSEELGVNGGPGVPAGGWEEPGLEVHEQGGQMELLLGGEPHGLPQNPEHVRTPAFTPRYANPAP